MVPTRSGWSDMEWPTWSQKMALENLYYEPILIFYVSKYLYHINEKDKKANLPAYAASNTAFISPISLLMLPIGLAYQLTPKKTYNMPIWLQLFLCSDIQFLRRPRWPLGRPPLLKSFFQSLKSTEHPISWKDIWHAYEIKIILIFWYCSLHWPPHLMRPLLL